MALQSAMKAFNPIPQKKRQKILNVILCKQQRGSSHLNRGMIERYLSYLSSRFDFKYNVLDLSRAELEIKRLKNRINISVSNFDLNSPLNELLEDSNTHNSVWANLLDVRVFKPDEWNAILKFDNIFDINYFSVYKLGPAKSNHCYLPTAFHHPYAEGKLGITDRFDVLFAGWNRRLRRDQHRAIILNNLAESFNVAVIGAEGWDRASDVVPTPIGLSGKIKKYPTSGSWHPVNHNIYPYCSDSFIFTAYPRAKICLDLPWPDRDIDFWKKHVACDLNTVFSLNYRVFEIGGAGGVLLTLRDEIHENLGLVDYENCLYYDGMLSNMDDLIAHMKDRISFLLNHPGIRHKLRRNIKKLFWTKHTHLRRWEFIVSKCLEDAR